MDWISVKDRLPKEGEFRWVNIRKGDKEYTHSCKVWENEEKGTTSFVNILFEKEQGVTHWRPEPEEKEVNNG